MRLGLGLGVTRRRSVFGGGLGPNIAAPVNDGAWTTGLAGATQDAAGLHFTATGSGVMSHTIVTEDNATYEITYTIVVSAGSFHWQLYGATTAHLGTTTTQAVSGTYTERVSTSGAGSLSLLIRAGVLSGVTNTIDVTALTVRKVLP